MALCENQVDINLHNNGNETVMENNSGNNNTLFDIIPTKHEGVYKIISSEFQYLTYSIENTKIQLYVPFKTIKF